MAGDRLAIAVTRVDLALTGTRGKTVTTRWCTIRKCYVHSIYFLHVNWFAWYAHPYTRIIDPIRSAPIKQVSYYITWERVATKTQHPIYTRSRSTVTDTKSDLWAQTVNNEIVGCSRCICILFQDTALCFSITFKHIWNQPVMCVSQSCFLTFFSFSYWFAGRMNSNEASLAYTAIPVLSTGRLQQLMSVTDTWKIIWSRIDPSGTLKFTGFEEEKITLFIMTDQVRSLW